MKPRGRSMRGHRRRRFADILLKFALAFGANLADTHRPRVGRGAAGLRQPLEESSGRA